MGKNELDFKVYLLHYYLQVNSFLFVPFKVLVFKNTKKAESWFQGFEDNKYA